MAWETEMVSMLRVIIMDLDAPLTYTDARLQHILTVAATFVQQEVQLDVEYDITVSSVSPDISPDPTDDPRDDVFINLTVIRAACLLDMGGLRAAALVSGLEARCGPVMMQTLKRTDGFGTLIELGYCATYQQLKKEVNFGNVKWCRAVLSPFVNETVLEDIGFGRNTIGDDFRLER